MAEYPPMKPEARQRMAALLATRAAPDAGESASSGSSRQYDGPESRPLAERCILGFGSTAGPPTLPNYFYNNLKQIVQTDDWVMIYIEMVHDVRMIRIGGEHLPSHIKLWLGDSIGHWEGDTLVVETTNFTDKTRFRGSGEDLKVTERFTRLDGQTILYRFTVEDPSTWERPWTGEYTWRATDEPIYEYACHEGNYALPTVLRGARVAEADAEAAKNRRHGPGFPTCSCRSCSSPVSQSAHFARSSSTTRVAFLRSSRTSGHAAAVRSCPVVAHRMR